MAREFWIYQGVNEGESGYEKAYGNRSAVYTENNEVVTGNYIHVREVTPGEVDDFEERAKKLLGDVK